jgi:hypothetical protein
MKTKTTNQALLALARKVALSHAMLELRLRNVSFCIGGFLAQCGIPAETVAAALNQAIDNADREAAARLQKVKRENRVPQKPAEK